MKNFVLDLLYDGLLITTSTLTLTFLLDLLSIKYLLDLFKKKGGYNLYLESIIMNLFNNLILGTFSFVFFLYFFENLKPRTFYQLFKEYILLLIIQSFGYYFVHRLMHTTNFYFIHKFHHQYSELVIPMSANSVSVLEYIFAYVLPFVVGILIVNPSRDSLKVAIYSVSIGNLLIHTPWLAEISNKIIPNYFVKTSDHLEHHRIFKRKFAAPILNIDYFVDDN